MMWFLLMTACDLAATRSPRIAPVPPPRAVRVVDVDPLVAGLPARVRVAYPRMVAPTTLRLAVNNGRLGQGPCAPVGSPCLALEAPVAYAADVVVAGPAGTVEIEVSVPQAPQVALQLMQWSRLGAVAHPPFQASTNVNADRDGDGLTDLTEADLGTDLWNPDTDGDGFGDAIEVFLDADPLDAADVPSEVCDNGIDDDQNGLLDCEDAACATSPSCAEVSCDDGVDDDLDGLTDCLDDECWGNGCGWTAATVTAGQLVRRHRSQVFPHVEERLSWRLSDASGRLVEYDAFGAAEGSCSWHATNVRSVALRRDVVYGFSPSWNIVYANIQQQYGTPTFGPGCVAPARREVIPEVWASGGPNALQRSRVAAPLTEFPTRFLNPVPGFQSSQWWVGRRDAPWVLGHRAHETTHLFFPTSYYPPGLTIHTITWTAVHTPAPLLQGATP